MMVEDEDKDMNFGVEQASQSILDQVDAYLQDNIMTSNIGIKGNPHSGVGAAGNDDSGVHTNVALQQAWGSIHLDDESFNNMMDYNILDKGIGSGGADVGHWSGEGEPNVPLQLPNPPVPQDFIFSPMLDPNNAANDGKKKMSANSNASPFMVPFEPSSGVVFANDNTGMINTPYLRGNKETKKNGSVSGSNSGGMQMVGGFSPLTSPAITPITTSKKVVKNSPRMSLMNSNNGLPRNASHADTKRDKRTVKNGNSSTSTPNSVTNSHEVWDELMFRLPVSSMSVSLSAGEQNKENDENVYETNTHGYPKVVLPSHSTTSFDKEDDHILDRNLLYDNDDAYHEDNDCNNNENNEDIDNIKPRKNKTKQAHKNDIDIDTSSIGGGDTAKYVKTLRATESPVIKPKVMSQSSWKKRQLSQSQMNNIVKDIKPYQYEASSLTASNELIGTINNMEDAAASSMTDNSENSSSGNKMGGLKKVRTNDDETAKRNIHKAAEQERRNRLNLALNRLKLLIPEDLKQSVEVPSKATTVELACQYIEQLKSQLQQK
ncbi:hypothetical protein TPHA_0C04480 [Tetrapisispora phaffii CBS 4417]|uniref:BHLH domain-containing protein n=1 Tax=Tetrapisispora phaffii (strain ATCC 24235 / CBS 4417 / NBRC 1672 / NRRL Y-8282 / UCD 70-5) TaxID=1071381 RepID=G8BQT7_TETPH|nr:hypothetical protein TPHA_0C04480 [Tetrapisispora phaffii CBS 4417]CCE62599.1 hypothetical protein TPHA_0C04480 [Tetrapisispora phaffii CBS 4417]